MSIRITTRPDPSLGMKKVGLQTEGKDFPLEPEWLSLEQLEDLIVRLMNAYLWYALQQEKK